MNRAVIAVALVLLALLAMPAGAAEPPRPQIVYAVSNIAALRTLGGLYPHVHVSGYFDGSIRGGGDFIWDGASSARSDNCIVFAGGTPAGRWLRELPNPQMDVTMCGAKWDGVTDDAQALSAAFAVASRQGLTLTCPGGTGKVAKTVAPTDFKGVVFRCQGMATSTILCAMSNAPCFLFQNQNGTAEVQAPQFYDMTLAQGPSRPTVMIQYNSIAGGFTDNATTQSYMMRPIVKRVGIQGGEIGVQCSKCFDGDMSLDLLTGQTRLGFDLEGSDWMGIGAAGTNRVVGTGGYPIKLVSHGAFGNGNLVVHNDILAPKAGVGAYIWSSARTSYIEKNFLEGHTGGACEITIQEGALHVTVRDNHVTDPSVANWLCVVPRLAQAEFSDNQTTSYGQGPARFEAGKGAYNSVMPQTITHFGNWSEAGFP